MRPLVARAPLPAGVVEAARYMFALSREKMLPKVLGAFHPTRYAPSNASAAVSR